MNIDKGTLVKILRANTPRIWKKSDISDEMLNEFNKKFAEHLKVYPGYDPLATDDYRGKQDDAFMKILMHIGKVGKQDLGFGTTPEKMVGESLTQQGWPDAYMGMANFTADDCENALDNKYGSMSWAGIKSIISRFPSRFVRVALDQNQGWASFKKEVRPYLNHIAAFCLGPKLDGDVSCWSGYDNSPALVQHLKVKNLDQSDKIVNSIMEAIVGQHPMSTSTKVMMRHEMLPNLSVRVYENSFEMDASEFADIAAALNSTAANLAEIVQGFVSKAIAKAREVNSSKSDEDKNGNTDTNQEIVKCYQDCVKDGKNSDDAIASCATKFNVTVDVVKERLTAANVNLGGAATTAADNNAAASPASNDPNAGGGKTQEGKDESNANPFSLHVNKRYQTESGQVLTLRKMSMGQNPMLIFEDESTGEKIELLRDKFLNMNPTEANIDSTKMRRTLINKFKRRINLSAMKQTAKIIFKTKAGRKVYENLDSIKSGGKPVGDIAGVSIGNKGNGKNQVEYVTGNKIKAGDIVGTVKGFKINESEEPEIVVKTPEGDEVTITVSDFAEASPELMPSTTPIATSVEEHVEYKGYSLLQNAEDQTWSVMKGEEKIEDAQGMTEDEAKAWVDAKLEEEGGEGGEEEEMNEGISRKFIKESKNGSIQLKTFSEVLSETKNAGLRKSLVATKKSMKK